MEKTDVSRTFSLGSRSQRWLRVGPLARDLDGFAADLAAQGYARKTAKDKLGLVRRLSLWLESEGLGAEALDEGRFDTLCEREDLKGCLKAKR